MESHKVLRLMVYSFFLCFVPTFPKQEIVALTPNQSIQYDKTLVSAAGTFEAGFFNLGNPQRQYFGIWYKTISPRTIVWVANRDAPVLNSTAILKLTDLGTLVILDGTRSIVWSSNSSRIAEKPVVQLLDSGNLVVKVGDSSENLLWESFDYPGDTYLPGMKLESNLVTGPYRSLTSWRDPEDPAEGEFSLQIDPHGLPQLVAMKGAAFYDRAGPWNGYFFSGASWLRLHLSLNFSFVVTDKEVYFEYETWNGLNVTRTVLGPTGITQHFLWSDQTQNWQILATRPQDQCEYYGVCGANSNCKLNDNPMCECLEGFIPKFQAKWNSYDWSGGCVRRINLNCHGGGDGFLKYTGMQLPDTSSSWFDKSLNLEECRTLCLKNCSCSAYANLDVRDGGSGCVLWFGNIMDLRKHTDQGQDIYTRLASSELDHVRNKRNFTRKKLAGILVGIITFIMCLTILGLATTTLIHRKKLEMPGIINKIIHWKDKGEKEDIDLPTMFDFSAISNATNHFSNSNKLGEGGFGPVYKMGKRLLSRGFLKLQDKELRSSKMK